MAQSTDTPSDAELIHAAASGNMGAFSQLVSEHRQRVLRTAFGILGSTHEAEDVAQDVFLKVWNGLAGFRGQEGAFTAWLYRITVNTAISVLRRRHNDMALDNLSIEAPEPTEELALRHDSREQVRAAVASLPEGARSVLVLREYEQLSYREIAEALQIPIGTVMSRLNYARQMLRKRLNLAEES
jgi:RNA polymerase sigma-70 factor, ECF subfamily